MLQAYSQRESERDRGATDENFSHSRLHLVAFNSGAGPDAKAHYQKERTREDYEGR